MKTTRSTILLAAEPTLARTGLVTLLHQLWPEQPLTLTADATQLVDLVRAHAFPLLILDGGLPGRQLPTLLHHLHQAQPTQRLLLLVTSRQLLRAMPATPRLLALQHITPSSLAASLGPWLNELAGQPLGLRSPCVTPTHFSPRELEVLRLVADDHCNQEIANQLYLSVRTVESHRRALLQKSGARTLVGLVAWALREGMVA